MSELGQGLKITIPLDEGIHAAMRYLLVAIERNSKIKILSVSAHWIDTSTLDSVTIESAQRSNKT